jgi:hypothetical protein
MDFRDSFIFYGDNPKTHSKAECERDAKLLFRSHLHSSHDSDQHFSNGKNSEHKTYSKADCARGTKLLFRSRLHSPHNNNQHLLF